VAETDTQNVDLVSLRKQVKLLAIVSSGLCILGLGLLIRVVGRGAPSDSGWPAMSAGVLQAKKIVLMTDDGKPAAILSTADGSAGFALLDTKGEVRVLLSSVNNRGLISLSGENEDQSTNIRNGILMMGDEKAGGIIVEGPPAGGPVIRVFDQAGYSAEVGRSAVLNHVDGTVSVTSAASLIGSSKEKASTWSLLSQPVLAPAVVTDKQNLASKPSTHKSQ